jgi:hypothetical protein
VPVFGLAIGQIAVAVAQEADAPAPVDAEELPSLWEFRLAAFGRYSPVYPGAKESDLTLLPLPIPVYRGSFLSFGENLDQVARGDIAETRHLRFGLDVDFTFGEKSSGIPVRAGMPDLDFLLELGPELEVRLGERTPEQGQFFIALQLRGAVSMDGLDPSYRGLLLNPQLEYRRDQVFGRDYLLSLRWKPTWAGEDYMDYYYQVDPAFANAGRPAYDATPGYLGSKFTAALTHEINKKLVMGMSASYYFYGEAENETSPLFQSDSSASVQVAFVWKLAESERRAKIKSDGP